MSTMNNNRPEQFATMIADLVRSGIKITACTVVAALTLATAYVALRTTWWAVQQAVKALGV